MPSGVDMADAMQVVTEVEYIMASIGLRRFFPHSPDDLISLTSQVPSSAIAERIAAIARSGRGMSCRQSSVITRSTSPVAGRSSPPARWMVTFPTSANRSRAAATARSDTS